MEKALYLLLCSSLFLTALQQKCSLVHQNRLFDLTALRKQAGLFWTLIDSNHAYTEEIIMNVCAHLDQCSNSSSSICAPIQAVSLGEFASDLAMTNFSDHRKNNLRLVYTGGGSCGPYRNKTTTINFICDSNAASHLGMDRPRLTRVSRDKCDHEIYWRTREACEKRRDNRTSQTCRVENRFDLNPLAVKKSVFEATGEYLGVRPNAKFAFQICGKRLPSNLTFWGEDGALMFSQEPDLVYDGDLLYFKYLNASANKSAVVKMECSYEESLSAFG